MRTIEVERYIEAPQDDVWAVLANFPNIASWNNGVKESFSTSDATPRKGFRSNTGLPSSRWNQASSELS